MPANHGCVLSSRCAPANDRYALSSSCIGKSQCMLCFCMCGWACLHRRPPSVLQNSSRPDVCHGCQVMHVCMYTYMKTNLCVCDVFMHSCTYVWKSAMYSCHMFMYTCMKNQGVCVEHSCVPQKPGCVCRAFMYANVLCMHEKQYVGFMHSFMAHVPCSMQKSAC